MNWQERANHARAEALMRATAEARPEQRPPSSSAECLTCGSTTTATAEQRPVHGWVKATVGARAVEFCGHDHFVHFNRRHESMNMPAAVLVAEPARESTTWMDHRPGGPATRVATLTCSRCSARMDVDQARQPDGTWGPDLARVVDVAGWLSVGSHRFCSRTCVGIHPRDLPPVEPVLQVRDQAYQQARARAAVQTERERFMSREIPDRPARKGPR